MGNREWVMGTGDWELDYSQCPISLNTLFPLLTPNSCTTDAINRVSTPNSSTDAINRVS
ncbi:hypothetical protein [uncultured Nostoc sp.]|uniref:hypothetical protein n=1 Tax=uncultured Nostoc sp. TaxID=340711 RepID=UPI0035C9E13C